MGSPSDLDDLHMQWDSGAPDLGGIFPSLAQQIQEYPAIESSVLESAYTAGNNTLSSDGNDVSSENHQWNLIVNGISYHIGSREYIDKDTNKLVSFNEANPGIGVERSITENISLATGVYRNSYRETSVYGLVSLQSDPLTESGRITVGIDAGVVSGYEGYIDDRLMIGNTGFAVMASPFVSVEISDGNDSFLPKGTDLKVNAIPGDALLGSDDPNAVDVAVGMSVRMPF